MFFKKLTIRSQLLVAFLFSGIIGIVVIGWQSYWTARSEIKNLTFNRLTAMRETKKDEVKGYFGNLRNRCLTLSESTMVLEAINKFKEAFYLVPEQVKTPLEESKTKLKDFYEKIFLPKLNAYAIKPRSLADIFPKDKETILLQTLYIANNPNPIEKKKEYSKAPDGSTYSTLHEKYHSIFYKYLERFGYYDLYFIDIKTGFVLFNLSKEIDFAANLLTGPLKTTNLAALFKSIQETTDKNFVRLVDYEFYDPSFGSPAPFFGTPVYEGEKKIGALVFELPVSHINDIMVYKKRWREVGLGETGETFLVGSDRKMRTVSRFLMEDPEHYLETLANAGMQQATIDRMRVHKTTIFLQRIDAVPVREVTKGNTDTAVHLDYRKIPILVSYTPLGLKDVSWGIISKIDLSEAFMPITHLTQRTIIWGIIVLLFLIIFALFFVRFFTKPIRSIITTIKEILGKKIDLTKQLDVTSKDEIGILSESFNSLVVKLHEAIKGITQAHQVIQSSIGGVWQIGEGIGNSNKVLKQSIDQRIADLSHIQSDVATIDKLNEKVKTIIQRVTDYIKKINIAVNTANDQLSKTYQMLQEGEKEAENILASLRENTINSNQLLRTIDDVMSSISQMQKHVTLLDKQKDSIQKLPRTLQSTQETTDKDLTKKFEVLKNLVHQIKQSADDITRTSDNIRGVLENQSKLIVQTRKNVISGITSMEDNVSKETRVRTIFKDIDHNINSIICTIQDLSALEHDLDNSMRDYQDIYQNYKEIITRINKTTEHSIATLKDCLTSCQYADTDISKLRELIDLLSKTEQDLLKQIKQFHL